MKFIVRKNTQQTYAVVVDAANEQEALDKFNDYGPFVETKDETTTQLVVSPVTDTTPAVEATEASA